jgi:hypothetical protein
VKGPGPDEAAQTGLARLLESTKDHHTRADDDGHHWADWYAEYLADRVAPYGLEAEPDTLSAWLAMAERTHQREAPEAPWPEFYARFLLRAARDHH